ncbi:33K [Human mastadenovirus C]|uniref:33K n=3 Tax=Human mastadenovirus C TaxID=129951 RepID=A0A1U9ALL2_ADE02|nr:splicing factor [Human mastadenovirus C]ANQ44579.1 33K [Human adenovirus 2]WEG77407.1 33K [Human adenovirus 89]WEG79799.1 protein 33K [Human adenovirus 108]WPC85872.1 protein 33K [Human adenovirus C108]
MAPKKKLQLPPPPPTDEEEYWDSQAEEVLDEEEETMEDWDSLDEEASEAEEVSDETPSPSVAFPSPAPQKLATVPSIATTSAPQAPPALPVRRPNRRWDTTGTRAAPTAPAAAAATAAATQKQRRPDSKTLTKPKKSTAAAAAGGGALRLAPNEPVSTRELRNRIFPTLYAIFQQSRGQEQELKIKNRSLRSLTRSCLYHKSEDQLRRTLEDAEALFSKYCALTLKD